MTWAAAEQTCNYILTCATWHEAYHKHTVSCRQLTDHVRISKQGREAATTQTSAVEPRAALRPAGPLANGPPGFSADNTAKVGARRKQSLSCCCKLTSCQNAVCVDTPEVRSPVCAVRCNLPGFSAKSAADGQQPPRAELYFCTLRLSVSASKPICYTWPAGPAGQTAAWRVC